MVDWKHLRGVVRSLRIDILRMLCIASSGHPGGSLSAIEILFVLYEFIMNHSSQSSDDPCRDRFVLSKGHAAPALYAVLARYGYFDKNVLPTLRRYGSVLSGHPTIETPGVEASTGSLGQGLSIAQGFALSSKLNKRSFNVFCMLGDGELQEGQNWEAIMSAPKFKLDNLIAIVDCNKAQIDGCTQDVMDLEPLVDKWVSFGWITEVVEDGHDLEKLTSVFRKILDRPKTGQPCVVIAKTIKGKGVAYMEQDLVSWHGKIPDDVLLEKAIEELNNHED